MLILVGSWLTLQGAPGHTEETDPSIACGKALATDARFSLIAKKTPVAGIENISLEMLADESKPNDAERKQLAAYVLAGNDCSNEGTEFRKAHYPPEIIAAMLEAHDKSLDTAADLYNRKISFGAFNKQLQSIASELRTKVAAIVQRIQSERAAQQQSSATQAGAAAQEKADRERAIQAQEASARAQEATAQAQQEAVRQQQAAAEEQRRQALLQFFANSYKPIQLPPVRPATQTNCIASGNSVNCTTY
jgi:hypothetical protein